MPKYEMVVRDIKSSLVEGRLHPGDRLPTTAELCKRYDISKITVNRAMEVLTQEGLVIRKRGKGTFVLSVPEVEDRVSPIFEVHVFSATKPDAAVGRALALGYDEFCYYLVRTCNQGGCTLFVEYDFLPIRLAHALRAIHVEGDLYQMLKRDLGLTIVYVQQTVSAYAPSEAEASLLGCATGDACVKVEDIARLEDGSPVLYSTVVHAPGFTFNSISRS